MPRKKSIPLNPVMNNFDMGIFIGKISSDDLVTLDQITLDAFEAAGQSHRDDHHFFVIQETGDIILEIDFQKYKVNGAAVIYIHPGQVHRILSYKKATTSFLAIRSERIRPEYLKLLRDIAPVKPLGLKKESLVIFSEMASLCIKLFVRKDERLHYSILEDNCNAFIGLITSQYLKQSKSTDKLTRFEVVTKIFKAKLEQNFITSKRPVEYAEQQNITTSYLNECVKNTTGYSVSYHIQQRVILEARRLLYYSDLSVKEIAAELGFDDYPYFSRLFTNVVGISALTFRNKNRD